jgi:large subunit ribosomal protein L10
MSKKLKDMMTEAYRKRYEGIDSACVIDMTGLNVMDTAKFRSELGAKDIRVQIVKNSLAKRAFRDMPLGPLGQSLDGPCALVIGGSSTMDVAKELVAIRKQFPKITLKDAIIEGDEGLVAVEQAAKMKGRLELIGEALMLVASPGRAIAGCLSSPQGKIAGCLKAMVEKGEAA